MSLDILTPRGQITVLQEQRAAEIWSKHYPDLPYIQTNKDQPAAVDGLLIAQDDKIVRLVECKCREMTLHQFMSQFRGEWLITKSKVDKGIEVAREIGCGLMGWLYLVPDDVLLAQTISDATGRLVASLRTEITQTKRTVNGVQAIRENAFIDMRKAKVLR